MSNVTGRSWPTKRAPDGYATPTNAGTPTTQAWPKARDSAAGTAAMDILADAVFRIDAADHQRSGAPAKVVRNLGTGGSVLDCRTGSTSVPDTNDPMFLPVQDRAYVYLPGVAGNDMSIPHVAGAQVGDDVDVRLDIAPETWNPSAAVGLAGKGTSTASAATYCWTIFLNTSSRILAQYSDGTNTITYNSATGLSGLIANQRTRLRIRYVRNTGSGQYAITVEQSTDFTTALADITSWTVLNTQTGASIGAMTDVANPTFIGTYRASSASVPGKFYDFALLVNGSSLASVDTSVLTTGSATSFTAVTGQTVTINRATSGRKTVVVPSSERKLVDAGNVYLPGVAGNYLSLFSSVAYDTNTFSLRVRVAMDTWTPAANTTFVSRYGGAANTSDWALRIGTNGRLILSYSNGTSTYGDILTNALGYTSGTDMYLRWDFTGNDGAGNRVSTVYSSKDGTTWTQLEKITTAGTITLPVINRSIEIGARGGGAEPLAGRVYSVVFYTDLTETTKVLDIDTSIAPTNFTPGYASAFPAVTGQTVTLNSTAGSAMRVNGERWASGGPVWLFGTDDYITVPNSATGSKALDFSNNDSLTAICVLRNWGVNNARVMIAKRTSGAGYSMQTASTGLARMSVSDGNTNNILATTGTAIRSGSTSALIATRRTGSRQFTIYDAENAATATGNDTTTGVLTSATQFSIGADGVGASPFDGEFMHVAVWRRILSAAEIQTLTNYFQGRYA